MAHLSGDEGLIEAFASGEDLHSFVASRAFDIPIEDVDPEMRRRIKAMTYGLAYGLSRVRARPAAADHARGGARADGRLLRAFRRGPRLPRQRRRRGAATGYTETTWAGAATCPTSPATTGSAARWPSGWRSTRRSRARPPTSSRSRCSTWTGDRRRGLRSRMLLQVHDELVLEVAPGSGRSSRPWSATRWPAPPSCPCPRGLGRLRRQLGRRRPLMCRRPAAHRHARRRDLGRPAAGRRAFAATSPTTTGSTRSAACTPGARRRRLIAHGAVVQRRLLHDARPARGYVEAVAVTPPSGTGGTSRGDGCPGARHPGRVRPGALERPTTARSCTGAQLAPWQGTTWALTPRPGPQRRGRRLGVRAPRRRSSISRRADLRLARRRPLVTPAAVRRPGADEDSVPGTRAPRRATTGPTPGCGPASTPARRGPPAPDPRRRPRAPSRRPCGGARRRRSGPSSSVST